MDTAADQTDLTQDFRSAMRRVASSVFVITCRQGEAHLGMTASSVVSVSMDPPSLLVCINRAASIRDAVRDSLLFCVNLLAEGQGEIGAAFGGQLSAAERFAVGEWIEGAEGLRHLAGAAASMLCRLEAEIDYGTHTICVGRVTRIELPTMRSPLLYHNGRFANLPG